MATAAPSTGDLSELDCGVHWHAIVSRVLSPLSSGAGDMLAWFRAKPVARSSFLRIRQIFIGSAGNVRK